MRLVRLLVSLTLVLLATSVFAADLPEITKRATWSPPPAATCRP